MQSRLEWQDMHDLYSTLDKGLTPISFFWPDLTVLCAPWPCDCLMCAVTIRLSYVCRDNLTVLCVP